ncbi:ClpX C4-type zinc finger protein [Cedecea sp. MMO-103]|uniref:ClpX C4-type zinc finger protein n=1 Tax=Cedecea sp. MMO-103 TaxID=3081238 RepID=UPI00301A9CAB
MQEKEYENKSLKLLGITARLQAIMINQNITPLELVNCASAARLAYTVATGKERYEIQGLIFCDFCGQNADKNMKLVAGQRNAHICAECVDVCCDILNKPKR